MKVAVLGGGPAGLYFAISHEAAGRLARRDGVRTQQARRHVRLGRRAVGRDAGQSRPATIRSAPSGSGATSPIGTTSPSSTRACARVSTGHGFCGIGRKRLLMLLQRRARELGIKLSLRDRGRRPEGLYGDARSGRRRRRPELARPRATFAEVFKPDIDMRKCKFVWLGTHQKFDDAFTFIFENTEHGWVWAHAYQFDNDTATFIVECSEETWTALRLRRDDAAGSRSPPASAFSRSISAATA